MFVNLVFNLCVKITNIGIETVNWADNNINIVQSTLFFMSDPSPSDEKPIIPRWEHVNGLYDVLDSAFVEYVNKNDLTFMEMECAMKMFETKFLNEKIKIMMSFASVNEKKSPDTSGHMYH